MKDGWVDGRTNRHTGLKRDSLNLTRVSSLPVPMFLPAIPIKFSEKQQSSHYLYVREHKVREGTKSSWPQKRTLFVLNVPPYCTEVNGCLEGNLSLGQGLLWAPHPPVLSFCPHDLLYRFALRKEF